MFWFFIIFQIQQSSTYGQVVCIWNHLLWYFMGDWTEELARNDFHIFTGGVYKKLGLMSFLALEEKFGNEWESPGIEPIHCRQVCVNWVFNSSTNDQVIFCHFCGINGDLCWAVYRCRLEETTVLNVLIFITFFSSQVQPQCVGGEGAWMCPIDGAMIPIKNVGYNNLYD